MPLTIPRQADAAYAKQAEPDSVDIDVLAAGYGMSGVRSGCAVTATGPPTLWVDVAAGVVLSGGKAAAVNAGAVQLTADATNARRALIVANDLGAKSVVLGIPAANPFLPAVPVGSVALAAVEVPAGATTLGMTTITDKRVLLDPGRAWVVVGDGVTNQTAELRRALEAARDSTGIKTVRIHGPVLVDAALTSNGLGSSLALYDGCTLEGVGRGSVLRLRAASVADGGVYAILRYQSNTVMRRFRVDGNKAAVASTGWTNFQMVGILGAYQAYATDVTFDTLWVHDVLGKGKESFGILTGTGERNLLFTNCRAWNVDGSGLSPYSDANATPKTRDVHVLNCLAWNNGWSGFSCYETERVLIANCRGWDNVQAAFNFEWSNNLDLVDSVSRNNGGGGIACHGFVDDLKVRHCTLDLDGLDALGNPTGNAIVAYAATSAGRTRNAGTIEIIDCAVRPAAGRAHIWYDVGTAPTAGASVPAYVLRGPDTPDWTVQNNTADWQGNIRFEGLPIARSVRLGALTGIAWSGTATDAAYVGGGNLGLNPATITATAVGQYLLGRFVLLPRRRYRVRLRAKANVAAQPWKLQFVNAALTVVGSSVAIPSTSSDVGLWHVIDAIVSPGSLPLAPRFFNAHTAGSNVTVDYLSVVEIESGAKESEESDVGGAWDGDHPILGANHLWVDATGKLRIKSTEPTTDLDGALVDAGASGTAPGGAGPVVLHHPLMAASALATNNPLNTFAAVSDPNLRQMLDLRGYTKVRLMGRLNGPAAATQIRIQYHLGGDPNVATGDAGWATLMDSGGSRTTAVMFYSAEVAIPAAAQVNNVLIRAGVWSGDGVADPTISCCVLNPYP